MCADVRLYRYTVKIGYNKPYKNEYLDDSIWVQLSLVRITENLFRIIHLFLERILLVFITTQACLLPSTLGV